MLSMAPVCHQVMISDPPKKNPEHENGEKLFNGLTPQFSTT